MAKTNAEIRDRLGPAPATPIEALAHVLAVYATEPDDRHAIIATSGVYEQRTGLTWGDLRALYARVQSESGGPDAEAEA